MLAGEPPHSFAKTASIRGSITSFAGRWGSCRATARTCSKRTARGDNRPEPPHQAVHWGPLPFLDATPTFETLVIVLDKPPMPIPVHPLPRLFERRGRDRGKPQPFQGLLGISRLLFPNANDPHGQRLLARSRLIAGWQERHLTKGKLEVGRMPRVTMPSRNLERTVRLARPGSCLRKLILDLFLALLYAP